MADHLIFVAESGYEQHKPHLWTETSVSIVSNGVDVDRFRPGVDGHIRAELEIDDDLPLIGFVGSFVPRKRPELFVEAAKEYLRESDGHFVMVGQDPEGIGEKIRRQLAGTRFEDDITLFGFREDIPAVAAALDLLVLTSTSDGEGLPRTPIEAMAAGTPVVTTDSGGVSEAVVDGVTGRVLDADPTPKELSDAMESVTNPNSRPQYAEAARNNAIENFSSRSVAEMTVKIYETLT